MVVTCLFLQGYQALQKQNYGKGGNRKKTVNNILFEQGYFSQSYQNLRQSEVILIFKSFQFDNVRYQIYDTICFPFHKLWNDRQPKSTQPLPQTQPAINFFSSRHLMTTRKGPQVYESLTALYYPIWTKSLTYFIATVTSSGIFVICNFSKATLFLEHQHFLYAIIICFWIPNWLPTCCVKMKMLDFLIKLFSDQSC